MSSLRSVPNGCVHFALVTAESTPTNQMLAVSAPAGIDGVVLSPSQAMATLGFGDVALGDSTCSRLSTELLVGCPASERSRRGA